MPFLEKHGFRRVRKGVPFLYILTLKLFQRTIKHSNHTTDEVLMQQIAMKNAQSFELLYERYSTRMFRYFYRMLWQDEELANDFTQDLFLKIIEKPHLFNPQKVFSTWIFSVANNMCKNTYRSKKTTENIDNQLFTYQENFDEKTDSDLHSAQLQAAINELSDEHRECFVLRYFEELSVKEIADITQSAEGTVKSRLHYGLRKVSKILVG